MCESVFLRAGMFASVFHSNDAVVYQPCGGSAHLWSLNTLGMSR